jgi:hypothetical protein
MAGHVTVSLAAVEVARIVLWVVGFVQGLPQKMLDRSLGILFDWKIRQLNDELTRQLDGYRSMII